MKLYFVSRWGSPKEGPNGEDTNFLIYADDINEAGNLADNYLQYCPWLNCGDVNNFVSYISELGESDDVDKATVLHGPWIANAILRANLNKKSWERVYTNQENTKLEWVSIKKLYDKLP